MKKNIENPFYSIPLNKLQDLIHWFAQQAAESNQKAMYPTKKRIDEIINSLNSKMQ